MSFVKSFNFPLSASIASAQLLSPLDMGKDTEKSTHFIKIK